jgi:hypothetical protein
MPRRASLLLMGLFVAAAAAQNVYNTTPDWTSSDRAYSTGGALVDINRDGWLDLVVANGNDIRRERLVVYYNRGDGTYNLTPDWQSADLQYNGHLDIADVNGDGWPDVAVAVLLNEGGHAAKLYLNNGGTLSSTPDWTSSIRAPSFAVAFGDMNGDGRPDLAVGTGFAYDSNPHVYRNVVYLNQGGVLAASPSWQSSDTWCEMALLWTDADDDGWLDLVGVGSKTRTYIYRNLGGTLEGTASWSTDDSPAGQMGLMAASGDVDADGWRELFIVDNNQLGGSGRFKRYNGQAGGYYSRRADWSYFDGYAAALTLADVNADRRLDLATGTWFGKTRLFFNRDGQYGNSSDWTSAGNSTVEKIVFGDINRDGGFGSTEVFGAGPRRLYFLSRQPIEEVTRVVLDGRELGPAEFTFSREHGWVSIASPPAESLRVSYSYSVRLDMAVTNWDDGIGNHVYYSRLPKLGDTNGDGRIDQADLAALLAAYASCEGDGAYNVRADFDLNGCVDQVDLAILLAGWTG